MMMEGPTETDEEANAAAEMELGDGNYLLSVLISRGGATLSIEVEHKADGRRWQGDFTARYIEEITKRAGNVKSFSNFVKMLRFATTSPSSKSLHVDVLTYQDLQMLKDRKNKANDADKKENFSFTKVAATSDKRYLILTYITEFDRVHYPLPLLHKEPEVEEETTVMKECIQRLQSELESMKIRLRQHESPQHTFNRQRATKSIPSSSSENDNYSDTTRCYESKVGARPSDSMRKSPQPQETRALQEKVRMLEDKLRTEAMAHQKSITILTRKNTLLQDEARKARVAERRLIEKLRDNEFQIGLLRGKLKSLSGSGNGAVGSKASPLRTRRPQRMSASPPLISRYINQGRLRPSSSPPAATTTRGRFINQDQLRRPSTTSPRSRHVLGNGPSSLPSRSRTSSPMYSQHSTTPPPPPPPFKPSGRSSSCPTSSLRRRRSSETDNWRPTGSSRLRKDVATDNWRQATRKQAIKRCPTRSPSPTTTRTTTPRRSYEGRPHMQPSLRRSNNNRSKMDMEAAANEVEEIDCRLFALQDYLKRMNS